MMTKATLRNMEAKKIWDARDELIDARADGLIDPREAAEQIELLYNLAEAVESGADAEYQDIAIGRFSFEVVARVPASSWIVSVS